MFDEPGIYMLKAHNRVFKTGFMAWQGYIFYTKLVKKMMMIGWSFEKASAYAKTKVLWNCPTWTRQPYAMDGIPHIVNYPHTDYYPFDLYHMNVHECFVGTDQGEQFMDARKCTTDEIISMGYWNYQSKKTGNAWHFDTVREKNIDPRIRLNPDFYIYLNRVPSNFNLPLQVVRIKAVPNDDSGKTIKLDLYKPYLFFPLWNHKVRIERKPDYKMDERQLAKVIMSN